MRINQYLPELSGQDASVRVVAETEFQGANTPVSGFAEEGLLGAWQRADRNLDNLVPTAVNR